VVVHGSPPTRSRLSPLTRGRWVVGYVARNGSPRPVAKPAGGGVLGVSSPTRTGRWCRAASARQRPSCRLNGSVVFRPSPSAPAGCVARVRSWSVQGARVCGRGAWEPEPRPGKQRPGTTRPGTATQLSCHSMAPKCSVTASPNPVRRLRPPASRGLPAVQRAVGYFAGITERSGLPGENAKACSFASR